MKRIIVLGLMGQYPFGSIAWRLWKLGLEAYRRIST